MRSLGLLNAGSGRQGFAERSLYFDGGTSRLTATDAGSPSVTTANYCNFSFAPSSVTFAICAWIRPQLSGLAAPPGVVSRRDPASSLATGYTAYLKPDGRLGGYMGAYGPGPGFIIGGAHTETTSSALSDDTWQHVIWNYDGPAGAGAKWTFLVNAASAAGTSIGDVITVSHSANHANPMLVGGDETKYEGWIRDIAVYDQIITGADATALYNGGVMIDPRTVTSGGIDANLIGYLACGRQGDSTSLVQNLAGTQSPREFPNFTGTGVSFSPSLPGAP